MKICRICHYFPLSDEKLGGAPRGIYYMTKAQANRGNDMSVITSKSISRNQHAYEKIDNIKIHRIFSSMVGPMMPTYWMFGFNAIKKFNELDAKENFDLIHAHDRETFLFALHHRFFKKKPLFLHSHGLMSGWKEAGVFDTYPLDERINVESKIFYESLAMRSADFIFVYSEYSKKEMHRTYGIDFSKMHVIKNGCDVNLFKPIKTEFRKQRGINENDFVILIPSINIRKGVHTILKAIKKLIKKHSNIKIIALGPAEDIQDEIPKNMKNLFLLEGQVEYDKMPMYYNSCDLFLLPTVYEGLPKSIIEAMACGKPVLSTNVCGIPELIKDGENGFLVEPKNSQQTAEKIDFIIQNQEITKRVAQKGRDLILQDYTWDKFAERIEEGYEIYFENLGKQKKFSP